MKHFATLNLLLILFSMLLLASCGNKKDDASTPGKIETVSESQPLQLTGIDRFRAYLVKTVDYMKTDEYKDLKKDNKKFQAKAYEFARAVGYTGTDKEIKKQLMNDMHYGNKDKSIRDLMIQTITVTHK